MGASRTETVIKIIQAFLDHYKSTSPTSGPRNRVLQTTQNGWSPPPCHATRPLKDSPRPRARDRSAARSGTRRCCTWKDRPNPGTTGSGEVDLDPRGKGAKNKKQKPLWFVRIEKSEMSHFLFKTYLLLWDKRGTSWWSFPKWIDFRVWGDGEMDENFDGWAEKVQVQEKERKQKWTKSLKV